MLQSPVRQDRINRPEEISRRQSAHSRAGRRGQERPRRRYCPVGVRVRFFPVPEPSRAPFCVQYNDFEVASPPDRVNSATTWSVATGYDDGYSAASEADDAGYGDDRENWGDEWWGNEL
jgi:hypothetical protein